LLLFECIKFYSAKIEIIIIYMHNGMTIPQKKFEKLNVHTPPPPPKVPYFDVVVGLACLNDPESYTGGSIASGRASHARQVEGDDPDKNRYPGPPGWGLGVQLTSPHKNVLLRSFQSWKLDGNNKDDPA
jgi:hypothetical protein